MSVQNRTELSSPALPAGHRKLGLALLVIATAQLMLVLDDTIVNVALPSMQRSLHLATSHLNWVISFYALAFGGLLLAGGRAVGCTTTGMQGVAPRDSGVAAGLLNTSVQVGNALGLAGLAAIASVVTRSRLPGHAVATALTDGYVAGLLARAVLFAVGAIVALGAITVPGRSAG